MKFYDKNERELMETFEKTDWVSTEEDVAKYKKLAQENMKKAKRINIRISVKDLADIKRMAALEGIPYQTFISSVLHKYTNRRVS